MDELLDQMLFEFGVEYGVNSNEIFYQQEQATAKNHSAVVESVPYEHFDLDWDWFKPTWPILNCFQMRWDYYESKKSLIIFKLHFIEKTR